jgi:hypothetical protein
MIKGFNPLLQQNYTARHPLCQASQTSFGGALKMGQYSAMIKKIGGYD